MIHFRSQGPRDMIHSSDCAQAFWGDVFDAADLSIMEFLGCCNVAYVA